MAVTPTTYGSNTALSALGDLAGELASGIESFTNVLTSSSSAVCQDAMKTQITNNIANYPALSVPGRISKRAPENLPAIDIIRQGIVVQVELDGEYNEKYNIALQKAGINQQANTGYVFIGSVTPYGVGGRRLHIYQAGASFSARAGVDFYTQNGDKIIVMPVTREEYGSEKWYNPNNDPGCNLGIFAPDNILTNQSGALVAMPNYGINIATYHSGYFLAISDRNNGLVGEYGEKYEVTHEAVRTISQGYAMLWYPVLLNAPSFISKLLSNNYIAVTLPPNFSGYSGYIQNYINHNLKPLEALTDIGIKFLNRLTTVLSTGVTLGSPIFYSNNCENFSGCSKEFLLGLVDGIANISQLITKIPLIVYTIRRVKLPTTMSEAYELAKSWGVGDVFKEVFNLLLTYMPVLLGVEKQLGHSIDELGDEAYDVIDDVVNAGTSAGKSVDDMVNEAVNKIKQIFSWL
ncbi:hypothetical protein [Acidianus manzaensis]|uniref:Uncharacterized protein n=1 Tax=Acidianus manzaensis TaxID=282676 RepID=A0A1W6K255_9CREN|nr:hypothetical protein [Acidianus manzaensis]ARM76608.1 hypothetical protein B6F84_11650 [Acidianus manzaensis]